MNSLKYHLLGDSHINSIKHEDVQKYRFRASSAMGLNNPKSISRYQEKFLNIYNKIPKGDKLMLKFGQVDTEFVYYIKLSNKAISFYDFAIDSVDKYFKFIVNNLDVKNINILSIYPPFLNDVHVKTGITRLHFMDNDFKQELIKKMNLIDVPSINERTKFNIIYNNLLKEKCNELNIDFIDFDSVLLNDNNESLYVNNHKDHHINNQEGIKRVNDVIAQFIVAQS